MGYSTDSKVAYSGVEGAFAQIAARKIFPGATLVPNKDFDHAFASVESGEVDYAVLPIENSYAGEVGQVMDLLYNGDLYVNSVYALSVTQNLMGIKGAKLEDIKIVYSHPQALMQSEEFLHDHKMETVDATNTAIAAKFVADKGDIHCGAIASKETAKLYGLDILAESVNGSSFNSTRFAVISKQQNDNISVNAKNMFMLMFSVNHKAGALAKAIDVISAGGYNMRSLHSRSVKNVPWQYYFYVEAEGTLSTPGGESMLEQLKKQCDTVKFLGHYNADEKI